MKVWQKVMVSCAVIMVFTGFAPLAMAHNVTVHNATDSDIEVSCHYGVIPHKKTARISPNLSHTFDTEARCPYALSGWVYKYFVSMVEKCTTNIKEGSTDCAVSCWSSSWTIRKGYDGAYHFNHN